MLPSFLCFHSGAFTCKSKMCTKQPDCNTPTVMAYMKDARQLQGPERPQCQLTVLEHRSQTRQLQADMMRSQLPFHLTPSCLSPSLSLFLPLSLSLSLSHAHSLFKVPQRRDTDKNRYSVKDQITIAYFCILIFSHNIPNFSKFDSVVLLFKAGVGSLSLASSD